MLTLLSAAHLGTPGLGMYCASQWAIEGYCDVKLLLFPVFLHFILDFTHLTVEPCL